MENENNVLETESTSEKYPFEWAPEHRLKHIPEDVLQKAMCVVEGNYIDSITSGNKDGKDYIYIKYNYSGCKQDLPYLSGELIRSDKLHTLTRTPTNPIDVCNNAYCMEKRCVITAAGYIYYAKKQGILEELLRERDEYRAEHENKDENVLFDWEPKDSEKLKNIPIYMFDLAEEMIKRGLLSIRAYPSAKNQLYIDIRSAGKCDLENKNSEPIIQDLIRLVNADDTEYTARKNGWFYGLKGSVFQPNICPDCKNAFCPYFFAGYLLYLKRKGQEELITQAKEYSRTHPDEIFYGKSDFDFTINDAGIDSIKESIATAPKNICDAAIAILDMGEASLGGKKDKDDYYQVRFSRKVVKDFKDLRDYTSQPYDNDVNIYLPAGLADYEGIPNNVRLYRLVGAIDYCRRKGIDISDALSRRDRDIAEFKKLSKNVEGIDRLYSFLKSEKTSSLFNIVQGEKGSGKKQVVEQIATVLSQSGKITSSMYTKLTLQQLSEQLTKHKTVSGDYSALTSGYEYSLLTQNTLYVLTGLDDFLADYNYHKERRNFEERKKAIDHLVKVLGGFTENTYVIIVSLSENSTKAFLDLDKKYKFTYGQNIIVLDNKSVSDLYDVYSASLSEKVSAQITDVKEHKKKFAEFIALNERFLPYSNDALAHYLSEYSNVEGAPVLPPDVYDRQSVREALDNMIGMQAVKDQLHEFESYITFQKKAKAAGLKVTQGNLHMQFLGNPGTGKTTIARIVAKMLYDIGILDEDKVIEVERKDLVAQYLGQTAIKTSDKIKEAMGGVLFVDEAYSLYMDERDSFGKEAIATLIKSMEDHKDDFVVILAGYNKEMNSFLKANPGIESRIGYTFRFEDYTSEEMREMFKRSMTSQKFTFNDAVLDKVEDICDYYRRRKNFGNGRFVKKIEQETIINHANNSTKDGWDVTEITSDDIPDIAELSAKSSGERKNDISLENIIGMNSIKEQILKFRKRIRFEQNAKAAGAKIKHGNFHMIFLGNPGTGKTTIARIITNELYEAGIILENKLIETERKDLIAEYIGQTAPKTEAVIERAMGGVLFIDEAYALTPPDSTKDFGHEALATLIKAMEDHKDEFVVIFAGYEKEMKDFIGSNSGIASRIGYTFTFEDYNAQELTEIFKLKMDISGLACTDEALEKVNKVMQYFCSVPDFGNGRFAERVANFAIELHADRMSDPEDISYSKNELLTISEEDIPDVKYMLDHMPDGKNMINPEKIKDSQHERTAVHELGHALIQKLMFPENSIERITIAAEGTGALGYVRYNTDVVGTPTKNELEARICVSMAGIAAEEVFLGDYGCGGTSDLSKATDIARNMVTRYGMSRNGFACFKELDDEGRKEINDILQEQFENAKKHIEEHRSELEKAKAHLLSRHTISDEEFTGMITVK